MINFQIEVHEDYILINGFKIFVCEGIREYLFEEFSTNPENSAFSQFAGLQNLPGLLEAVGLPDMHSGYAFPIGSVAAVDLSRQDASVSPEGVGYDINCGVRCLRTNLMLSDIENIKDELADCIFKNIPSGMGDSANCSVNLKTLNGILDSGLSFLYEQGEIPLEDLTFTESRGTLRGKSSLVYQSAKGKGLNQIGSLGSGNHYLEVQVVEEIFDKEKAEVLKIKEGQIVISIHTGSRGLGHSICDNFLAEVKTNDSTVKSVNYASNLGQKYMSLMFSASNFAWANRAIITKKVREAFKASIPNSEITNLYDASHNIAKIENINYNGEIKELLVHRKGASRILEPNHPDLPDEYKSIGQPVLIGGSMGTCSYLIVGTERASETFNSTCHGAGRVISRGKSRKIFTYEQIADDLNSQGIVFRCGTAEGIIEEAGGCYKDVNKVVEHSDRIGITKRVAKLKPVIVIKG